MNRLFFFLLILLLENSTLFPQDVREGIEVESWKYNFKYVESLSKKAEFWFSAKKYDEAIRIGKEKLIILERILGRDSLDYAIGEAELSLYIAYTGQYKESILLAENALNKIEKIEGKESALYAMTAQKLSAYYFLLEDYDKALIYIQQAVDAFENTFGTSSDYYISSKVRLANTYTQLHRFQDAIEIQKDCNEYYFNRGDSVKYAQGLHDISLSYAASGDYSKALNYCKTSSKLFLHHLGQDHLLYIETLKTLADYYVEVGDFNSAFKYSELHVEVF